ncbi:MAG: hypothetical protein WDN31_12765 [Hyphomicrobium sp.]
MRTMLVCVTVSSVYFFWCVAFPCLPKLALACALFCFPIAVAFADPGDSIGSAVAILNDVTGAFRQDVRALSTGDDVRQDEVIAAGATSVAELMLRDETKLAIGPGARLTLDRFVYNPERSGGAIVLNLLRGRVSLHHRRRREAGLCHPHAGGGDHGARHRLRCLCRGARAGVDLAARRRDPGLQRCRQMSLAR